MKVTGLGRSIYDGGQIEWLLRDVQLEFRAGERIGLTGPSGSGKTLLMRAIAMLDSIDVGEILWNGTNVSSNQVPKYRRDVCYVPQRMPSFEATVRETLQFPFSLGAWKQLQYNEDKIVNWLSFLHRERSFLDKRGRELSGGENQIVRLFLALQAEPTVLLLDEPTSAMDSEAAFRAEDLVGDWQRENGRVFLWCSHSRQQLDRVATRQLKMNGGRLGLR